MLVIYIMLLAATSVKLSRSMTSLSSPLDVKPAVTQQQQEYGPSYPANPQNANLVSATGSNCVVTVRSSGEAPCAFSTITLGDVGALALQMKAEPQSTTSTIVIPTILPHAGGQSVVISGAPGKTNAVVLQAGGDKLNFVLNNIQFLSVINATLSGSFFVSKSNTAFDFSGATLNSIFIVGGSVRMREVMLTGTNLFASSSIALTDVSTEASTAVYLNASSTTFQGFASGGGTFKAPGSVLSLNPNGATRDVRLLGVSNPATASSTKANGLDPMSELSAQSTSPTFHSDFTFCGTGPSYVLIPEDGILRLRLQCSEGGGPMRLTQPPTSTLILRSGAQIIVSEVSTPTSSSPPAASQCIWYQSFSVVFDPVLDRSATILILACGNMDHATTLPTSIQGCQEPCRCTSAIVNNVLTITSQCGGNDNPSPDPSISVSASSPPLQSSASVSTVNLSEPSGTNSTGLVVGVAAGVAVVALLLLICVGYCMYKKYRNRVDTPTPTDGLLFPSPSGLGYISSNSPDAVSRTSVCSVHCPQPLPQKLQQSLEMKGVAVRSPMVGGLTPPNSPDWFNLYGR